jgi:hypothetical protein
MLLSMFALGGSDEPMSLCLCQERANAFAQALMVYSHVNYRNVGTLLERYQPSLKVFGQAADTLFGLLDGIFATWSAHPDVVSVILNMLVSANIAPAVRNDDFRHDQFPVQTWLDVHVLQADVVTWLLQASCQDLFIHWRWASCFAVIDVAHCSYLAANSALDLGASP